MLLGLCFVVLCGRIWFCVCGFRLSPEIRASWNSFSHFNHIIRNKPLNNSLSVPLYPPSSKKNDMMWDDEGGRRRWDEEVSSDIILGCRLFAEMPKILYTRKAVIGKGMLDVREQTRRTWNDAYDAYADASMELFRQAHMQSEVGEEGARIVNGCGKNNIFSVCRRVCGICGRANSANQNMCNCLRFGFCFSFLFFSFWQVVRTFKQTRSFRSGCRAPQTRTLEVHTFHA